MLPAFNWGKRDRSIRSTSHTVRPCARRLLGRASIGAALLAVLCAARVAAAQSCVEMDAARDNLSESDRRAAQTMLEQALIDNGRKVVNAGPECSETFRAFNVKLGESVNVTVSGPQGSRTMHVRAIEDIPGAYSQITRSLISGKPLATDNDTIDRTNVTDTQTTPNRVEADSLWYLRLGYGGIIASGLNTGPAFGFGWRKELDHIGIDASFLNFVATRENDRYKNVSGSIVKLMVTDYFDPFANSSLYGGGGLSWGVTSVQHNGVTYSDSGIQGELALGYEMLRASNIRLFVQFDASFPFYTAKAETFTSFDSNGMLVTGNGPGSVYAPVFGLSLGLGFGKSNTLRVRQTH